MADVAMGFLFVRKLTAATDACLLVVLLASSSLLYIAGIVLNDVFDLELDSRAPTGRCPPAAFRCVRPWFWAADYCSPGQCSAGPRRL